MRWAQGMEDDAPVWQAAEVIRTPSIRSFVLGGLDHSFLVSDYKLDVLSNWTSGLQTTGITIPFGNKGIFRSPKKGMLMRGETNMMLISRRSTAGGVSQLGKMVAEWTFEKDGIPITMKDVTNDSKGAQLDSRGSTFLGLDDYRLCRWDMRVSQENVQQLASPAALSWTEGHQFWRRTNFQCFATAGDGSIVVGSRDGKVRLYGTTSMRRAYTAFPSLGSPITHVDVTYDGKWVLATTDTYLILISTSRMDKYGTVKTGFTGRGMGGQVFAPRLLKLLPVDASRGGTQQRLHGGKFSWVTEEGKEERHLVVSAGKFTVVWDFDVVKDKEHDCYRGITGLKSCYCYEVVVAKPENIVQSSFMHENFLGESGEVPLVVATWQELSSYTQRMNNCSVVGSNDNTRAL